MSNSSPVLNSVFQRGSKVPGNGCVVKIGDTKISLDRVAAPKQTIILKNGLTCEISFNGGILVISTQARVDITITGNSGANGISIETAGRVKIDSKQALTPQLGICVKAKQVALNAPVFSSGVLNLQAKDAVTTRKPILVAGIKVKTNKIVMTGNVKCAKALIESTEIVQSAQSNFDVGHEFPEQFKAIAKFTHKTDPRVAKFITTTTELNTRARSEFKAKQALLKGSVTGKDLDINILEKITIKGRMVVDTLKIKANYIRSTFGSCIDGLSSLNLKGKRLFATGKFVAKNTNVKVSNVSVMFFGVIQGKETLNIKSLTTNVLFGGRLWGMTVIINTGIYFNLLGWGAAHNFVSNNLISLDLGLITPYIPRSWREVQEMCNRQRLFVTTRLIASYIFKPAGVILRVGLKMFTLMRNYNKLAELYAQYKASTAGKHDDLGMWAWMWQMAADFKAKAAEGNEDFEINTIEAVLATKNILFAGSAFSDAYSMFQQDLPELHVPNDYASAKAAAQEHAKPILFRTLPAFVPAYVVDSVYSFRAGITVTGVEVQTHSKLINKSRSYNLGAG